MANRTRPTVTVITPTYNRADYLPETIESILNQNYPNLELLVLDDGSDDNTRVVVQAYMEKFGNTIKYFYHDNMGEAATINRGWPMATGDYVAIVSSDDPMLPGWLEKGIEFMEGHPEIIVGYPDWQMIDEHSRPIREIRVLEYDFAHMVAWSHCMPGPGAFIRRGAIKDIKALRDPSYRLVSDLESWLRLGLRGPFGRIPHTLATWRLHSQSVGISVKSYSRALEHVRVIDEFFAKYDMPPTITRLRRYAKSRAWYLAAVALIPARPFRAGYYILRSLLTCPTNPPDMPYDMRRFLPRHFTHFGHIMLRKMNTGNTGMSRRLAYRKKNPAKV